MLILVLAILIFLISLWLYGFYYANELSVPSKNITDISSKIKKVLIVFPHADDEAFSCSGLISALSQKGIDVHWMLLTKGEKGTNGATYKEGLKEIRVKEAQHAASIYGVHTILQRDYPDNDIQSFSSQLKTDLKLQITHLKPDLVITFDLAGLYGHPDHIVASEVITDLIQTNFPNTKLWYISYPKRILDTMKLPEHMAKSLEYKKRRVLPTFKVWVGVRGIIKRIRAVYGYDSQLKTIVQAYPTPIIPLWFYLSLAPFEYFHEVE